MSLRSIPVLPTAKLYIYGTHIALSAFETGFDGRFEGSSTPRRLGTAFTWHNMNGLRSCLR